MKLPGKSTGQDSDRRPNGKEQKGASGGEGVECCEMQVFSEPEASATASLVELHDSPSLSRHQHESNKC